MSHPALVIYALGSAAPIFVMSLVKSRGTEALGDDDHASGREYALVVIVDAIGALIGTPLMTATWIRGMDIGGIGLGLPYFISAVCEEKNHALKDRRPNGTDPIRFCT